MLFKSYKSYSKPKIIKTFDEAYLLGPAGGMTVISVPETAEEAVKWLLWEIEEKYEDYTAKAKEALINYKQAKVLLELGWENRFKIQTSGTSYLKEYQKCRKEWIETCNLQKIYKKRFKALQSVYDRDFHNEIILKKFRETHDLSKKTWKEYKKLCKKLYH